MNYSFDLIHRSSMPERFKQSLLADMNFIKDNEPSGLKFVLLFGSLSRSSITCRSDIDLCLVFEDTVDIDSYHMRVFRGMVSGIENPVDTDIVMLYESQLASNSCRLYQEINRDKIILAAQ